MGDLSGFVEVLPTVKVCFYQVAVARFFGLEYISNSDKLYTPNNKEGGMAKTVFGMPGIVKKPVGDKTPDNVAEKAPDGAKETAGEQDSQPTESGDAAEQSQSSGEAAEKAASKEPGKSHKGNQVCLG